MHVASLELCSELYELSGWEPDSWYELDEGGYPEEYLLTYEDVTIGRGGGIQENTMPAYDLGFILRKLPKGCIVSKRTTEEDYQAIENILHLHYEADTPEDAAAKLAIELFKAGVLQKEEA